MSKEGSGKALGNFAKHPEKVKIPPTASMKGLQAVMGGVFFLTIRLMVTGGLSTLMLFAASVLWFIGFIRWRKKETRWKYGCLLSAVLFLCGCAEFWGYTAEGGTFVHALASIVGTAAAAGYSVLALSFSASLCIEKRAEDTAGILRQRRWWVGVGYAICGIWSAFSTVTGLYPDVGIVMRILSILVNVFYLSALFQVRKLLE